MIELDFANGVGIAQTVGFEQFLRLALELVEVGPRGPLAICRESVCCWHGLPAVARIGAAEQINSLQLGMATAGPDAID